MLCLEALERSPRNADAMNLLGVLRAQRGDQASALEWLGRAVAIDPQNASYRLNFGKVLLQLKRVREACESLERAIALDPRKADAHNELGLARAEAGLPEAAEAAFRKALSLRPDYWEAHNNLGVFLQRAGRAEEAVASLRKTLELEPRSPEVLTNLGMALRAWGLAEEAVRSYRDSLALRPGDPGTLINLGNALADLSRNEEAIDCFRAVLASAPNHAVAHYNWGSVQSLCGRPGDAAKRFRAALAAEPRFAEAECGLASALRDAGDIQESIAACRRALELDPGHVDVHSQLLFSLLHSSSVTPLQVFDEHREWARRHAASVSPISPGHSNPRVPERRLRIGYVSGDFRRHSVAQFFEPVLDRHDRAGFEIFCYYNAPQADATTERLRRRADGWRDIAPLGDDAAAERICADRIDVLVDLSGHTRFSRLLMFARRPVPVQMTWLGYAETTGLTAIGYRITDEIADPPESLASETLLRLPQGFLSYRPPVEAPPVEAPPSTGGGYVTFGSFSNLGKLGPDVIELWGRILAAVPGSRLLVKALSLADPETKAFTEQRLLAHGVAPGRFDCAPGTSGLAEHLAAYHRVDIALDPFPYNGTTTTCEALWMGVPVVTLAGTRHAGRVGASLLARLGMEDMIADSPETYMDKAVALARDPARLAALRAGMRDRIAASPLMDAGRFTRDLEQAYRWAWRRWCENPDAAIGK